MFKSGKYVAEHIEPHDGGELDSEQIQPNGVDLTIDKVYTLRGPCMLGDEYYHKNYRDEAPIIEAGKGIKFTRSSNHKSPTIGTSDDVEKYSNLYKKVEEDSYALSRGPYVVVYNEEIHIPEGHVGFVLPRSRLLRTCNHLTTAVWDSGYRGRGEGALQIGTYTVLEKDMRIGQMVFCRANSSQKYTGHFQGERIDE